MVITNADLPEQRKYTYHLIDWNKPKPVFPERVTTLTKHEASYLNKGFALNRTTKRYVKQDDE